MVTLSCSKLVVDSFFKERLEISFGLSCVFYSTHCNEDPIYVFPEMKLRGLIPNIQIHVSVSDLYIPTIGSRIFATTK
jgi:hypothetical protein